jgi:hypothetical protein
LTFSGNGTPGGFSIWGEYKNFVDSTRVISLPGARSHDS